MNEDDRIRLPLNPANLSVPAGFGDIYFKRDGSLIVELPGGVTKPIGGGGGGPNAPLTNAEVNAAIAQDPEATQAALDLPPPEPPPPPSNDDINNAIDDNPLATRVALGIATITPAAYAALVAAGTTNPNVLYFVAE